MSDETQTVEGRGDRSTSAVSRDRTDASGAVCGQQVEAGLGEGFWATVKRSFRWNVSRRSDGWIQQPSPKTCGAAALAMLMDAMEVAADPTAPALESAPVAPPEPLSGTRRLASILGSIGHDDEASLAELQDYAVSQGLKAHAYALALDDLLRIDRPAIVHWNAGGRSSSAGHFVVLRGYGAGHVLVIDPARGNRFWPAKRFARYFLNARGEGYALFVAPATAEWLPLKDDLSAGASGENATSGSEVARRASSSGDLALRPWHRFF